MHGGARSTGCGRRWGQSTIRIGGEEEQVSRSLGFSHYKIDKSQLCDAALAKLVSLHHTDRRTISGRDKWLPIGDIVRGR